MAENETPVEPQATTPAPAPASGPAPFVDPDTGLTATMHDGRVWFNSGGKFFSAGSVAEGLQHDPGAQLATPAEVQGRLVQREQDTFAGQAKIAAKQTASHAIDVATGLIRYPAMGIAALADSKKSLDVLQQLGGEQVLENTYGLYREMLGQNQEAAGREYHEATVAQTAANPLTSEVSGIVGDIVPAIATGGLSAAGKVSGGLLSEQIATKTLGNLGEGVLAKAGEHALAGAIQGVGFGMQSASENTYLTDDPLTRQKVWAAGAMGGLLGGAIAGTVSLAGSGVRAALRPRLSSLAGPVDVAPKSSLAEAIGDSTVTKEAAQEVADRAMAAEGVPAAPGLGEKLHSLLTDIQAGATGAEKEAVKKYGLGAILDPKTRVAALDGMRIFRNRDDIINGASSEISDSMKALQAHADNGVFQEVRDLGMKRNAWEKLVDPAKRGEQVDAARAFVADTRGKLESMLREAPEAASNAPRVNQADADRLLAEYGDTRVLRDVPIGDIKRSSTYMGSADDLSKEAARIRSSEITPVELELGGDGRLSINDGNHRIASAKAAGFTHIPALVPAEMAERYEPAAAVEAMPEGPVFGDLKRVKSLLGHVKKTEALLAGDVSGADAAIELDAFKRNLGKLTKGSVKRLQDLESKGDFEADAVRNTARHLSDTYENLRQNLMNDELWGKAASAQKEINAGWQDWIDSRSMYSSGLMRRTGSEGSGEFGMWDTRARYEIDPNKVGSWIDQFGTGRGKLNDHYVQAHIDATDKLTAAIGKYVDTGTAADSVAKVREAVKKIQTQLGVARETVAVANQVQLVGGAQLSGAAKMGMAAGGAMMGGPLGGAAGAALGFLMSPGKAMHAAMTIQGLLEKVNTEKASQISSFFSKAARKTRDAAKVAGAGAEDLAYTEGLNSSGAADTAQKAGKRAVTSAALRLFGGSPAAQVENYNKRREQLAALTSSPELMVHQTARALGPLPGIAPQLAASFSMDAARNLHMLQGMAPQASPIGGMFGGKRKTFTPQADIERFAHQWDGVMNPLSVLADLNKGSLNMDKVAAAKAAHPELFAEIAGDFLEKMAHMDHPMNPQAARQADILLGLNGAGDPTVAPEFLARIATLQQAQQEQANPPPSPRPPVNLAKGTATLSQSLEGA